MKQAKYLALSLIALMLFINIQSKDSVFNTDLIAIEATPIKQNTQPKIQGGAVKIHKRATCAQRVLAGIRTMWRKSENIKHQNTYKQNLKVVKSLDPTASLKQLKILSKEIRRLNRQHKKAFGRISKMKDEKLRAQERKHRIIARIRNSMIKLRAIQAFIMKSKSLPVSLFKRIQRINILIKNKKLSNKQFKKLRRLNLRFSRTLLGKPRRGRKARRALKRRNSRKSKRSGSKSVKKSKSGRKTKRSNRKSKSVKKSKRTKSRKGGKKLSKKGRKGRKNNKILICKLVIKRTPKGRKLIKKCKKVSKKKWRGIKRNQINKNQRKSLKRKSKGRKQRKGLKRRNKRKTRKSYRLGKGSYRRNRRGRKQRKSLKKKRSGRKCRRVIVLAKAFVSAYGKKKETLTLRKASKKL